ncbi:hypothetical protein ACVDG3_12880 [Meridianimarinicoccus sp. RP-17]
MTAMHKDAEALVALLDTERRLILAGRFEDLGALLDDKARLVARLGADRPPAAAIGRLRARAGSNLALLAAAREGIAAAQARLHELERLARGAGGYDRRGARVDGAADPRTFRRV